MGGGITNVGVSGAARLYAFSSAGNRPSHIGIGSGTTAFAVTQTGLFKQIDRNAITGSADISVLNKATWTAVWTATDITGANITEVGVFNHAGSGDMSSRHVFDTITKDTTIELEAEVTYEFF